MNSNEKGDALEAAVHAIEGAILRACPGYSEKTFRIERKKLITVGGVRHEVDVWVTIELPGCYESIFIFECKN